MYVRFGVSGALLLSAEPSAEAAAAIGTAAEDANRSLFRKGVPREVREEDAGRIVSWSVEGRSIRLRIESGPYTRAHDALFRFRKHLQGILGKYRIGIRGVEVASFEMLLPPEVPREAIPRLPFVGEVRSTPEGLLLELEMTAAELEDRMPDRLFRLVEEKMEARAYGGKAEHWELLHEHPGRVSSFRGNPTEEMLARKWIRHGASRGQWIYAPQAVRLFRALESIIQEEILTPLGFSEMIFPKLSTWEVCTRSGHAKGVYPEIYYVCTPKTRDPAAWEDVADYFKVTGRVWVEEIRKRIDGPIGVMCYAQCPPFWPFMQGETIANDVLPIRIFDRSGTSHRYESGGIHGIERVDEFHRIELVWIGTVEQTIGVAEELHRAYRHVFEDVLELRYRTARVTPWFMAQEGMVGKESSAAEVGTTDYEAYMPYSDSWLEFQNVSVNGDKYPKGFGVKIQSGADCWSGCSGIGYERWVAAFLAQKGFDPDGWPDEIRARAGELKEIIRFV